MSSSTSATTVSQQQASYHHHNRCYVEQHPQEQQQPEQQHSVWEPGSDEAESAPTRATSPDSRTSHPVTPLGTMRQQFASALERNFAVVVKGEDSESPAGIWNCYAMPACWVAWHCTAAEACA